MIKTLFEGKGSELRLMTPDEAKLMLTLVLGEERKSFIGNAAEVRAKLIESSGNKMPSQIQMLLNRIRVFAPDVPLSLATCLFVVALSDRPGTTTLWAYTLIKATKDKGGAITMKDLAEHHLPDGIPTEAFCTAVWQSQKGHVLDKDCDNYLDQHEAYNSI